MRFSVSKLSITPQWPVNMGGYLSRVHKSTGSFDEIYSKALFLEEKGHKLLLLSLDLIGLHIDFVQALKNNISELYGLNKDNIVLHCTHSHSGPATYPFPTFLAPPEPEYMEFLEKRILMNIEDCMNQTEEGTLEIGAGETCIGMNRRLVSEGQCELGANIAGFVDSDLIVSVIRDISEKVRVILFNCACHPTVLGPDNYHISSNYCGAACKQLEMKYPLSIPIFIQGASGDIDPRIIATDNLKYRKRYYRDVKFTGEILANDVSHIIKFGLKKTDFSIQLNYEDIKLPLDKPAIEDFKLMLNDVHEPVRDFAAKMLQKIEEGIDIPDEVSIQIGIIACSLDFRIVTMDGEVCCQIGKQIKDAFRNGFTMIAGYTNGILSYIPTRQILNEGGYEAKANHITYGLSSPFREDVEDIIVKYIIKKSCESAG